MLHGFGKMKNTNLLFCGIMLPVISLCLLFAIGCSENTDQAQKHVDLGLQYFEEQEMQKALNEFTQAIQLEPDNADARYYLGGLYHANRAYSASLDEYQRVLRINPDYPKIHTAIANVYYELGLRAWGRSVKLDRTTFWFPDTTRELPFDTKEELKQLIEGYQNKLRADSVDAEIFSKLSQAYYILAVDEYKKAIRADSTDTTAQLYLGLAYSEQGYPHKAESQYEITKRLDSNQADIMRSFLDQKKREKEQMERLKKEK
jgi:Tfp pilus assembly protein PilF